MQIKMEQQQGKIIVNGVKPLAKMLKISAPLAYQWNDAGYFDDGVIARIGKVQLFDFDKVVAALSKFGWGPKAPAKPLKRQNK